MFLITSIFIKILSQTKKLKRKEDLKRKNRDHWLKLQATDLEKIKGKNQELNPFQKLIGERENKKTNKNA